MPKPRSPLRKARVGGRDLKNPQRYRERSEPRVPGMLGPAPSWMTGEQRRAWAAFAAECPWLNASHRGLVEVAVPIRARLWAGEEVGVQALNLLRQCLGQMGATPADASKVTLGEDEEDPDEVFFGHPN